MEPERISCCIKGCKRTFKAEVVGDAELYMCGKHFRCELDLLSKIRRIKRRVTKFERRYKRDCRRGITEDKLGHYEHLLDTLYAMHNTVFDEIRREAQRQQDAGFFDPKPRRRKHDRPPAEKPTKIASSFDREFARVKAAMQQVTRVNKG